MQQKHGVWSAEGRGDLGHGLGVEGMLDAPKVVAWLERLGKTQAE